MRDDILSPAASGQYIARMSTQVHIHNEGLEKLSEEILKSIENKKLTIPEIGADAIHPSKDHPKAVDWVFVVDTLNFCFWSKSKAEQWTVDGYTGYCALEAALYRAIKDGYDITNPEIYSKITLNEISKLFKGDTGIQIPLIQERLNALHEVGAILIDKYNGTFETCVMEANKSAMKLLQIVAENFPCFRDEAVYKQKKVSFYKRAQILAADLWNTFGKKDWGEFHDIDKITMFADYRVPQVLAYFGVLSYSDGLMDKLKNDVLLPNGSEEEVEIRGCSIHAVELLKRILQEKLRDKEENIDVPNSTLIDYFLWCYRRKHAKEMDRIPYHKTLGIYY